MNSTSPVTTLTQIQGLVLGGNFPFSSFHYFAAAGPETRVQQGIDQVNRKIRVWGLSPTLSLNFR